MTKLSDRVEALTGPDREIDVEIFKLVNPNRCDKVLRNRKPHYTAMQALARIAPMFTASLGAAMTLVPSDAVWSVANSDPDVSKFHSSVMPLNVRPGECSEAQSAALALTAAALRARGL